MELSQIGTIQANLTVLLRINKPTYVVFMHSHYLTIDQDSVRILNLNQTDIQVKLKNITHFPEVQQVRFEFDQVLVGRQRLCSGSFILSAVQQRSEWCLYMIEYTENGSKKWVNYFNIFKFFSRHMAATQFQPHHARSTLLSFEEPAMKAKFHISIEHPDDLTAVV